MKKSLIYLFFLFPFGMFCSSVLAASCEDSFDWKKFIFENEVIESGALLKTTFLEELERLTGARRNNIEAIYSILTFNFNMDVDKAVLRFISRNRRDIVEIFTDLSKDFRNQPLTYELRTQQAEKAIDSFIELLLQTKQEIEYWTN